MSFKQWIDFKQWSGDPPDEKFTIGNPCSWGTKKKNNNDGVLIIVWIFLQLRGRIFEPLGTDLMAHFVHFSQGSVGILLLCGFLMLQIPLNQWVKYKQQLRLPQDEQVHIKALGLCLQPGGNGREKSQMGGKTSWGAPGRCEDRGAWWGLHAWGVGEFSVLCAREGAAPPCCSKGQQLHSAFYELEEIVELGKAGCRLCFSLMHRIISSDYFFLVHFLLGCPEAVADAGVNRSVNFELFHPLLFPVLSHLSNFFFHSLCFSSTWIKARVWYPTAVKLPGLPAIPSS